MRMSIFGLGYVGMVNAACLAHEGHDIYGIDINPKKVEMVNDGISPIVEDQIEEILAVQVREGRLQATTEPSDALAHSDISFICVGTPSTQHGTLDLTQVEHVCRQIGTGLRSLSEPHTVVLRSTMLPGSTHRMMRLLSETSGRRVGDGLHVAYNPEFLREGTAVRDFYTPQYTVVGSEDEVATSVLEDLYRFLLARLCRVSIAEAEMLKYASNAFHATKVTFANEIGRVAKALGVDGFKVMDLICKDDLLNISSAYLRPGFAYGGSCLPKDLRSLVWQARLSNVDVPLLESLAWSNRLQIDYAYDLISHTIPSKGETIGFLGLAFKPGTDDLRESPMVELVERFIGKGYRLRLFDESVSVARLMGTNKEFIDHEIPHLAELMAPNIEHVMKESKVLVVGKHRKPSERELRYLADDAVLIDLEQALNRGDWALRPNEDPL